MALVWPNSEEKPGLVNMAHQPYLETLSPASPGERSDYMDSDHLEELLSSSDSGVLQVARLVTQWEKRQENTLVLLRQQLNALEEQRLQAERKYWAIMGGDETTGTTVVSADSSGTPPPGVSWGTPPPMDRYSGASSVVTGSDGSSIGSESSSIPEGMENSLEFWKFRCAKMAFLLKESLQREQVLLSKIWEENQPSSMAVPVAEMQEGLQYDNFLHLVLRNASIVIGHQDAELRHRFIYNMYPGLREEDIMGKTDVEFHTGAGIMEIMEWKREVLKKGKPMQRQFDVYSDLVGHKTFFMSVDPVMGKSGEALGINYLALDITEEAARREQLTELREEVAVQKSSEGELQKTLLLTEETMRAKQILATMAHEIRSPLSGVFSVAQLLATTKLDAEQRPMVELLNASGEHVLELINDILDLSKVESGAMRLEAKKFRPRHMIKRILQLAQATIQNKNLVLSGNVLNDVPHEVVGDVLRIRQVLMNLVSNAIKFTPKGYITIELRLIPPHSSGKDPGVGAPLRSTAEDAVLPPSDGDMEFDRKTVTFADDVEQDDAPLAKSFSSNSSVSSFSETDDSSLSTTAVEAAIEVVEKEKEEWSDYPEAASNGASQCFEESDKIWLHFEVADTGIGIPEEALPSLFEEYTQASLTTARKYGGTGLGLAICKHLVKLMGGSLDVKSTQYVGSSFSFALPLHPVKKGTKQNLLFDIDTTRAQVLPVSEPNPEVKGQSTAMESKLKQLMRDSRRSWVSAVGEGSLLGRIKSSAERLIPDLREGKGPPSNSGGDAAATSAVRDCTAKAAEKPSSLKHSGSSKFSMTSNAGKKKHSNKSAAPASAPRAFPQGLSRTSSNAKSLPNAPRILLADDNSINIFVAKSMLKKFGHSPEIVNTGVDAVEAVKRGDYDLVLMDCSMPVMGGLEATRIIRELEKARDMMPAQLSVDAMSLTEHMDPDSPSRPSFKERVPIIALTADVMPENMAECIDSGMDSFLPKPITFEKLEQILRQYIPWAVHQRRQAQ